MKGNIETGFSLVELMIAMVLGVLLTVGVVQLYLQSSQTYRLTEGVANIQENSRFVTDRIGRDLRQAGPGGCIFRESLNPDDYFAQGSSRGEDGSITDLRAMPAGWSLPEEAGVIGWESSGTAPGDTMTLPDNPSTGGTWSNNTGIGFPTGVDSDDFVGGSDVLVVQGSMGQEIDIGTGGGNNIPLNSASGIPQGTTIELVGPDCSDGFRFIKGNNESASSISVAGAGLGNQGGANINNDSVNNQSSSVHIFRSTLYYVGRNPNGEPSLYRQSLNNPGNSVPAAQELVAGVENMQVLYGIGNENGATDYVPADDSNLSDWNDVVSVRLVFVMRSGERTRKAKEKRTFNLLGMQTQTPEDQRVRVVATKTAAFRNRLE